ncbi:FAD-dependent oxidoreductase [Candidatus Saccharibacteria bacterium]|nr:FAD-dependent oxidoreductase [Candidatus Saccharibacteria bacterium]
MASKNFDFDLIVIGSGAAGTSAALTAASAGLRVAIVESAKWGGSNVNVLDLPFSAASRFAHSYSSACAAAKFGVSSVSLRYNYANLQTWLETARRRFATSAKKSLAEAGVTCLSGLAHFLSPYDLSVGKQTYSAPKFIIASGSTLSTGGIIGADDPKTGYLTPSTAFSLKRLPKNMTIIGAGATGIELAEYYATLGVKVALIDLAPRVLPREDEEVGSLLGVYLSEILNVRLLTQTRVLSILKDGDLKRVVFLRGGLEKFLKTETVLLATGRKAALDLGLENAGVNFDKNGITTDSYLNTSMKHIFAVGSCASSPEPYPKTTELSSYEGALAAANVLSRSKNLVSRVGFIRFVNTSPSVACVGLSEDDCLRAHKRYEKSFVPISSIAISSVDNAKFGFLKLIVDISDSKRPLLGASIVCPNAELLASELALAVRHRLPVVELASSPVLSNSYSELLRLASRALIK